MTRRTFILTTGTSGADGAETTQRLYAKAEQEPELQRWVDALRATVDRISAATMPENLSAAATQREVATAFRPMKAGEVSLPTGWNTGKGASDAIAAGAKSGYLYKRAIVSGRNWKRRFFILHPAGALIYYKDEYTLEKPRGVVTIAGSGAGGGAKVTRHTDVDCVKWVLSVEAAGKTLLAAGAQESETESWAEAILAMTDAPLPHNRAATAAVGVAASARPAAAGGSGAKWKRLSQADMKAANSSSDDEGVYDSDEDEEDDALARADAAPMPTMQTRIGAELSPDEMAKRQSMPVDELIALQEKEMRQVFESMQVAKHESAREQEC